MAKFIEGIPSNPSQGRLFYYSHEAARDAFKDVLRLMVREGRELLLPAYIGHSTREGSGIYDPVMQTGINHKFYKFSSPFYIDLDHLTTMLKGSEKKVLLIVNYFGFSYINRKELLSLCFKNNVDIIEDCAHSLFSFYRSSQADFRFAFFSLHKMFPYKTGGVLLAKQDIGLENKYDMDFFHFDLHLIGQKRRANYIQLLDLLKEAHPNYYTILFSELGEHVPQSFPILLTDNKLKDYLYFKMNENGFGVASLYHTLIQATGLEYVVEHSVSQRILNLPVHQDVDADQIQTMVGTMTRLVKEFYRS